MRAFDGAGALPPVGESGILPEGAQGGGLFRPLSFAGLTLPNNVLLAPMAGYTDLAYRRMCAGLGAGLTDRKSTRLNYSH